MGELVPRGHSCERQTERSGEPTLGACLWPSQPTFLEDAPALLKQPACPATGRSEPVHVPRTGDLLKPQAPSSILWRFESTSWPDAFCFFFGICGGAVLSFSVSSEKDIGLWGFLPFLGSL